MNFNSVCKSLVWVVCMGRDVCGWSLLCRWSSSDCTLCSSLVPRLPLLMRSEGCFKSARILLLRKTWCLMQGTQLICFCSHSSVVVDEWFGFCGEELTFTDTVVHLGHTLSCGFSDSEDIENKTKDFIRHANCLLANFGVCSPAVNSCLLQFFCTSFYMLPCGDWHVLNSNYLRLYLTKCYVEFGTFHTAAIEG